MNDIKWLDRVWHAYSVYVKTIDQDRQSGEHFLRWLYREYGVMPPDQRKQ